MTHSVAILIGSLRKESFCRKMADAVIRIAPEELKPEVVPIRDLEMYDQDLDDVGEPTRAWSDFRAHMERFDAVLFITPEYNRSFPAVLKNALDVGSRPYGSSIWNGKPGAVISLTPGTLGAFGANHQLRQALVFLNIPTMQQPEAYVSHADTLFDAYGKLTDPKIEALLKRFLEAFARWIEKNEHNA